MSIVKQNGTVTSVTDLTKTAKEVTVTLDEAIPCIPGSFMNTFMEINGVSVRRAYSVVATDTEKKTVTFAIRHTLNGTMTPEFWKADIIGRKMDVMGPLGKNTADKLSKPHVHLFAYGIGAGVIKAIAEYSLKNPVVKKMTITTGSRNEEDIIYKEYFDTIALEHPHVSVRYVVSNPLSADYPFVGYVQDNIDDIVIEDADIYMCGQEKACDALIAKINEKHPVDSAFFVEAFH